MTILPYPQLSDLLLRVQFHLMELALHERDLDFLLVDLEKVISQIREHYHEIFMDIAPAFEELQTHFSTKNRFALGTKLQIQVASHQSFPEINKLKPYLDQIERHLHANELSYHLALFQIALTHPNKPPSEKLCNVIENIKQHYPNRKYVDILYRELIPYYAF
ncbi:MAG: hypothetical protein ACRCSV_05350 [Chlamydiales bacterium]